MLHIILFILKILGFLILGILGLIILVTVVLLLSPFVYHAEASVDNSPESMKADIRFHWLFHLIAGRFCYESGTLSWGMRAAWKHFGSGKPPAEPEIFASPPSRTEQKSSKVPDANQAEISMPDKNTSDKTASAKNEPGKNTSDQILSDHDASEARRQQTHHKKSDDGSARQAAGTGTVPENSFIGRITDRISKLRKKIKYTFQKICAKIKSLEKTKERIEAFVQNEIHQNAFRRILGEVRRLLRAIRPKKADLRIEFGFQNPAYTGYLLAGISMIYPVIGEFTEIEPDFEHRVLRGEAHISGRLRILHAAIFGLRVIADKNVRTTIRHIRKFKL